MADTTNKYNFLDYEGLSLFWNNVKKVIEDNELVTATALTNLDTRVNTVEDALANQIISITYTDLKTRRDNAQLVPGQQYRITDYKCTTTQANTRAVGHQFDIIVTALDEFTLSEEAQAIQNSNDGYFDDSNLSAWKIWYCLDNDTTRFKWADETNGKGVIYRMIDEWNNDIPYDFKNIIYVFKTSFIYNQWGNNYKFIRDTSIDMNIDNVQYYGYVSTNTPSAWSENKCWIKEENPSINSVLYKSNSSVISYGGTITEIDLNNYETFTFGKNEDFTITTEDCYNNIILPYRTSGILVLNNNTFGSNCFNNYFNINCHNNIFGNDCMHNTFDYGCCSNTFGDYCEKNTFGNEYYQNKAGNYFEENTFGNICRNNTFGDHFSTNTFNYFCISNTFGNDCQSNIFGEICQNNIFGNYCQNNSFGHRCSSNIFATDTSGKTTASYFQYNKLENGVSWCIISNSETASDTQSVKNYYIKSSVFGTSSNKRVIEVTRNLPYDITVALNSKGELKIYCEADLIQ